MKRKIMFVWTVAMLLLLTSICAGAYNIGDVINHAQPTDIVAFINGHQLMSYNVDGYTYIVAEDLRHYGMNVVYDHASRSLSITRNPLVSEVEPHKTNPAFWEIGSNKTRKDILYTDIVTYVDGYYVNSYNINGMTIIRFDELARFGDVSYNNTKREISLMISGLAYNSVATLVDAIYDTMVAELEKGFNQSFKKAYGNRVSCDVFIRAKGGLIVYEVYVNGIVFNTAQKRMEQSALNDELHDIKSAYQPVKNAYPEMEGIALILYDQSKTQAAAATIWLD